MFFRKRGDDRMVSLRFNDGMTPRLSFRHARRSRRHFVIAVSR
jgi:hypothetical protein